MQEYTPKTFSIPELEGISVKNIEEHLKLYAGYVKNTNAIMEKMAVLDTEKDAYIVGELFRRFSFEYNGMRNHEIYFSSFEGGAAAFNPKSELGERLLGLFGTYEKFIQEFTGLAMTRGVGWAVLWYDKKDGRVLSSWVDEQHLGQLNGCDMILGLDMWEHAFVYDYPTSEKKKYVEAFFNNLNWSIVEENFKKAL